MGLGRAVPENARVPRLEPAHNFAVDGLVAQQVEEASRSIPLYPEASSATNCPSDRQGRVTRLLGKFWHNPSYGTILLLNIFLFPYRVA